MALIDYKRMARYFPAPIRKGWAAFIDELVGIDDDIPVDTTLATKEPTGFPQPASDLSTLSVDENTRTLTLTPVAGYFEYFFLGESVIKTTPQSVVWPDVEGIHHFYFNSNGTLVTSQSATLLDLVRDNAYVANLYWSEIDSEIVMKGEERHGMMPWQSHLLQHLYEGGTSYGGGLTIGDILADQSGALDTHCEFSVASGMIVDEDIYHSIAENDANTNKTIICKQGTGQWKLKGSSLAPIVLDAGVPQINTWSGSAWVQTPVTANNFFLAHIYVGNDWETTGQVFAIQGENQYTSKSAARAGALTEISSLTTSGLPTQEYIPIGTIIYEYKTVYSNTYSCRIVSTLSGDDYVNWLTEDLSPGSAPSAHVNTTGRSDPSQHPDTAIDVTGAYAGFLAGITTNVYAALNTLDNLFNGLFMANNSGVNCRQVTGGGPYGWVPAVKVNASDEVEVGGTNATGVRVKNAITLPYNTPLIGEDSGGTPRDIARIDSYCHLGNTSQVLRFDSNGTVYFPATSFQLEHNRWISFKDGGGTYRTAIGMSGSTFYLGHSSIPLDVRSNGTIQCNANDITTTGKVTADECDIDRRQNARTKTLTLGGGNSFAQCAVSGTPGSAQLTLHYEIRVTDATDVQVESGYIEFNMTRDSSGVQTGSFTKYGTTNNCTAGTLTVTPLVFTASANLMIPRVQPISTGLTTPTCVMEFSATGNGARTVTWV